PDMHTNGAPGVDAIASRNAVSVRCDIADLAAVAIRKYPRSVYLESVISVSNRISDQAPIGLKHNPVGAVLICGHAAYFDVTDRPDARTKDGLATDIPGYESLRG